MERLHRRSIPRRGRVSGSALRTGALVRTQLPGAGSTARRPTALERARAQGGWTVVSRGSTVVASLKLGRPTWTAPSKAVATVPTPERVLSRSTRHAAARAAAGRGGRRPAAESADRGRGTVESPCPPRRPRLAQKIKNQNRKMSHNATRCDIWVLLLADASLVRCSLTRRGRTLKRIKDSNVALHIQRSLTVVSTLYIHTVVPMRTA